MSQKTIPWRPRTSAAPTDQHVPGLLVLSRKKGETIVLTVPPSAEPTRIEMVLCSVRGGRSICGWRAAESVKIHRGEVQEQIDMDGAQDAPEGAGG